tara:strand:+ start:1163 stop:2290 length:1128 start_codon:yes stop_codon:yes gene_type:complete
MKKIFVLTGEPSGDKLASTVINKIQKNNQNIEYLSVGGTHLNSLGIKSIYDLREITYIGFTSVLMNVFKIKKKINETVDKIIKFKPDILFSVDSPDFTLRVAEKVKKIDPNIKTIHFVAPQVWVWREHRVKKLKKFLDHILLLFPFEKKYFDKENIKTTFTGHPLLEKTDRSKIDVTQIIKNHKKIISLFPGSRKSEINLLLPILIDFVKMMNKKHNDIFYVFHSTNDFNKYIQNKLLKAGLVNCGSISDEKVKSEILKCSIFAVAKSGTISLEICNAQVPSIIIYKMNYINYLIIKLLVKVKFANIINIAANDEIIPELIQSNCNSKSIYNKIDEFFLNNQLIQTQIEKTQNVIKDFKTNRSSEIAASVLINSF